MFLVDSDSVILNRLSMEVPYDSVLSLLGYPSTSMGSTTWRGLC